MTDVADPRLVRVEAFVEERLGIAPDPARRNVLEHALTRRAREAGCRDVEDWLPRLDSPLTAPEEARALARALTVGESFFFRGRGQVEAFVDVALPDRLRARGPHAAVRVLCAGAAGGEEPYTLAMAVDQRLPGEAPRVEILGVDVNPAALDRARAGRYAQWSLRETRPLEKARYFRPDGHGFLLDPAVRGRVQLAERNLSRDDPSFWAPGAWDVIFCRNVLIYLSARATGALVQRFEASLAPGGYLFLGVAETLRGLSHRFRLCHTHETFYYRLGGEEGGIDTLPSPPCGTWPAAVPPQDLPATPPPEDERPPRAPRPRDHRTPSPGRSHGPVHRRTAREAAGSWTAQGLRALVIDGRLQEARALAADPPAPLAGDPGALVALALAMLDGGDLEGAESLARRAVAADGISGEAHHVLALCREQAGDPDEAVRLDEAAAYLEPHLAMAHLHLGRLARRRGDLAGARKALRRALSALEKDDEDRVRLFGGGFGRGALAGLCRAELKALGGER